MCESNVEVIKKRRDVPTYVRNRWSLLEEERKVNRLLRDDPENDKLNDRLQQASYHRVVEITVPYRKPRSGVTPLKPFS